MSNPNNPGSGDAPKSVQAGSTQHQDTDGHKSVQEPPRGQGAGPGHPQALSGSAQKSEPSPAQSTAKADSPSAAANPTAVQLTPAAPGDKLAEPAGMEDVGPSATPRYREKYASIMREFQAGTLRNPGNQVVKNASDAKVLAGEYARKADAGPEQKAAR